MHNIYSFFHRIISYLLIIGITTILINSCRKTEESVEPSPVATSTSTENNSTEKQLDNAYALPYFLDVLIAEPPSVIADLENIDQNLADFLDSTHLAPEEELKKYLERQKEYDKSNIFKDVP